MFKIVSIEGGVYSVDGFYTDAVKAGFKKDDFDVGCIYSDSLCDVEFLFTTNKFQAAPIKYVKENHIDKTNFVLVNSKNANALTGKKGIEDIKELMDYLKTKFDITNPIMSSTGVIGVRLDKEKIKNAIDKFDITQKNENIARAIMTTDTFEKEIAFEVYIGDKKFTIGAMAKGAGMINPAMATMLCFITTDADIPRDDMKELLKEINEESFNAISVDGDTSTNDTVMLLANKKSGIYNKDAFREALRIIMKELALMIVKDGEGANKVVAFDIKGAKNKQEAKIAAKALTNSALVKTAIFGEDPNWGRIASTIGASGVECDEEKLQISFEDILVYDKGEIYFDKDIEAKAAEVMKRDEFKITCNLNISDGEFVAYGCDLSYDYVKINADYRT